MLGILAALLMQGAAPTPAAAASRPSVITNPDWAHKPTGDDISQFYPKAAWAANVEGRATIHCIVMATGDLADCRVLSEEPVGAGFGDAALALGPRFKMKPQTRDGVPVSGGPINIPIRFALPKTPEIPTLELALECYGASAVETERDPGATESRASTFLWQLAAQVLSEPEKLRPSEMDARLAAARKLGATTSPSTQARCKGFMTSDIIESFRSMTANLQRLKP